MRAFEIRNGFGLDHLSMTERPVPQPGPGQVLVQMTVRKIRFSDDQQEQRRRRAA
jgi:NADPH:quinone reductase-like Zn-dependent oxidoreductase